MIVTSWVAYASFALIIFLLAPTSRLSLRGQVAVLGALLLIGAIPLPGGMPLAGYLRALTDDLAITSLALLTAAALQRLGLLQAPSARHTRQTYLLFAVAGLVLYPAALGVGMLDPYRWGYTPMALIAVAGAVALLAVWQDNRRLAVVLVLATLAYSLQLKASPNYWDYLLDPLLVGFSMIALLRWVALRVTGRAATV